MRIEEVSGLSEFEKDYLRILRKKESRRGHWTSEMQQRYLDELV